MTKLILLSRTDSCPFPVTVNPWSTRSSTGSSLLKVKPQIPSVGHAMAGREQGITAERWDAETPHYRAVYDDKKRIVMLICHNTDLGDGWEEEGTDPWYFREFSEKYAYPLGINILFYALTH